ncbi:MAG: DUF21 domain-containing protein [Clostridia bacterium]|nr:DUF21 domain-containing protein [Clostridia bacterium]
MLSDSTGLIILLGCLIATSAFFSATETAFSSVNKIRLKNMAQMGDKRARLTLNLAEDYDNLLSTILIGNNIVNIASSSLATVLFVGFYGDAGIAISTAVMTVLVLIFGEITPKSIAKEMPEKFAMFSAPFVKTLMIVLAIFNWIFAQWKKLISRFIKVSDDKGITEEELITIVEEAAEDGGIDEHESELIKSAIDFTDLEVSGVLTPRTEVVAIELGESLEEIKEKFAESGYSRLPVYRETMDDVIGVVHIKDFFNLKGDDIMSCVKPVLYITDKVKISKLLPSLKEQKCHLAIVTDEYGGTMGIVTLEDVIEELVGEIWDEHDDIVREIEQTGEMTYVVEGSASVEKVFRIFDMENNTDSATVHGWVTSELEDWPKQGDNFEFEDLKVTILEVEERMAKKVQIVHVPKNEE